MGVAICYFSGEPSSDRKAGGLNVCEGAAPLWLLAVSGCPRSADPPAVLAALDGVLLERVSESVRDFG